MRLVRWLYYLGIALFIIGASAIESDAPYHIYAGLIAVAGALSMLAGQRLEKQIHKAVRRKQCKRV